MSIGFDGQLEIKPKIRAGFIGCGSHSRRNILPAIKFASVEPISICDLSIKKSEQYAKEFGFERYYDNHIKMIESEKLDAVFIVTNYDDQARPQYPKLAIDCLTRGCHVWTEKPPSAYVSELLAVKDAIGKSNKQFSVGFKKMFASANEKAKELSVLPEFGGISMALFQYPQYVPTKNEFEKYNSGEAVWQVCSFLDHLCHPVSLLLYIMGKPKTLYYERSAGGAASVTFTFCDGSIASLALTNGASLNGGMERSFILAKKNGHIIIDNNFKLSYHKDPPNLEYGSSSTFYKGSPGETTSVWEPELSLGQLYNKGLFILGYYKEIEDFSQSIINNKPILKAGIEDAINATSIFEAFAHGPERLITL